MPSYVVVGASRGLGYEWLRQLSSDPANTVIGLARMAASVESRLAADKITNVHILQADMADYNALNAAAADAAGVTNGSVDYLIINGAYNAPELSQIPLTAFVGREDDLRKDMIASLDVNVLGVIYSINAFLPLVRKSNIKKIVVISTGLADTERVPATGVSIFVIYSTMKAALNMVVAKYSAELKGDGITLLALSPGLVNTKETPPTAEEITAVQAMIKQFQTWAPDWEGPIAPAESISLMRKVIDNVTVRDSGAFLSHWGNKKWL
jgi:NAD(P)-dependent dehydrogenase (short-subunit alcohol dehydrogenase family)